MRRLALPLLGSCVGLLPLAACGSDDTTGNPTGPITASVTHYDYTLDLDSRARTPRSR